MGKYEIFKSTSAIVLFVCASTNLIFAKYSGGSGDPCDPYQIATPADLMILAADANDYNKCFIMTANINLDPCLPGNQVFTTAVIAPDIYGENYQIFDGTPFTGTFKGNGFTIQNLTIQRQESSMAPDYLGLFGQLGNGAHVSNLGVVDVNFGMVDLLRDLVGALAGKNNGGTIEQCYSTGYVKARHYRGGLVGRNNSGTIRDCYSHCTVLKSVPLSGAGGGLVSGNYTADAVIINCFSTGHLDGGGGLLYENLGTVTGSFWDVNTSSRPTSGGGTGKTTAEMQTQSTFTDAGWDFNDVWKINEFVDYPKLIVMKKYSGGSGQPDDPYKIANVADLFTLAADANDFNKCFVMTADIDLDPCLPGRQVFSTAVIAGGITDITGYGFDGNAFSGVFNGAGHKIINFSIDADVSANDYLGLFGDINGGEVKNLGVVNVEIISSGNFSTFCGGLAGRLENGVITNCYSTGNITAGNISWLIGGLVGENGSSGSISNSCSTCNVTGADNSSEIGGLAGRNHGIMNNCSSSGTVASGNSTYSIGGLVGYNGYNGGYIINSFSTCNVEGQASYMGGLAGSSDGIITDCFSTGSVSGGDNPQLLGGFVGLIGFGGISNCYSTGNVTGGDWAFNIGGFAGAAGEMSEPNISNCYSTGDVNVGNNSSELGGFIGQCQGNISYCYSTGNVSRAGGEYDMGGFAGSMNFGGDIIGSYYLDSAGPHNGLGIPLSDSQLKQQASFTGWDFVWEMTNGLNDVWAICDGASYPKLAWQFVPFDFTDFAPMGLKWQQADSTLYCGGSDLTGNGIVDLDDLALLCDNWLQAQ